MCSTDIMAQKAKTTKKAKPRTEQTTTKKAKPSVKKSTSTPKANIQEATEQKEKVDRATIHEKMLSQKNEYFRANLGLEPEQFDKFWDLYQQYDKKVFFSHENADQKQAELLGIDKDMVKDFDEQAISSEQALEILNLQMDLEKEIMNLDENFIKQLTEVIKPNQILIFKKMEHRFMHQIMHKGHCDIDKEGKPHKDKKIAPKPKANSVAPQSVTLD